MKNAFFHSHIEWIITVGLVVFAGAFYWLSSIFSSTNTLGSLFVNLCAGSITAIVVIWGVDYLRKKENQQRFAEINQVAKADISSQATMLVWYMANPLNFSIFDYPSGKDGYTSELIRNANSLVLKDILKSDLHAILVKFSVNDWKHLAMNIALIKNALGENLRVYSQVLPPEVLGRVLAARKAFNSLSDYSFAILIDLFVKEEKDWPVNKSGIERNRELRTNQITLIARDLKEYFSQVERLTELLSEINFY